MIRPIESSPAVPRTVTLQARKKAARHQRQLLRAYRHQVRDADASTRARMLEEGVPARQVLRLMAATGLSRLEMQRVTGLSAEQFDQQLAGDRPFTGAPGKALFSLIDLLNATDAPVESAAEVDAGPERLVGGRVRDWLAAEAAKGQAQEAGCAG